MGVFSFVVYFPYSEFYSFFSKEFLFTADTVAVAADFAVRAHHPMARNGRKVGIAV